MMNTQNGSTFGIQPSYFVQQMAAWFRFLKWAPLFSVFLVAQAMAGPVEELKEAFERNDYATALQLLRPLAEKGDADAQEVLGGLYLAGKGVPEDASAGVEWERKAADQGNVGAQFQLGMLYQAGRGVKQDYAEAMRWFLRAANQGDPSAQRSIAEMYAQGLGVRKDPAEANKWYAKSRRPSHLPDALAQALQGVSSITLYSLQPWGGPDIPEWDFRGHHILGKLELSGEKAQSAIAALNDAVSAGDANMTSGCLINPRHALRFKAGEDNFDVLICYQCGQLEIYKNNTFLLFEGSIAGRPDALNRLLQAGQVPLADNPAALKKSYAEEVKAAFKMAQQGDAKAQDVIARMLLAGRWVKKNEAEGIQWFSKSLGLAPDDPEFQTKLGKLCNTGMPENRNPALAAKMFQKAAAQGNAEAQYELGKLYEYGVGVTKDPAAGLKLIRESAEKGFVEAEFDIGVRHAQGRDLEQNYPEALKWLRKAADQSHPQALDWLGTMYDKGQGVPPDPVEAAFWDGLAVDYGTIYGTRVSVHLTPEQIATVRQRQTDWKATHPKRPSRW